MRAIKLSDNDRDAIGKLWTSKAAEGNKNPTRLNEVIPMWLEEHRGYKMWVNEEDKPTDPGALEIKFGGVSSMLIVGSNPLLDEPIEEWVSARLVAMAHGLVILEPFDVGYSELYQGQVISREQAAVSSLLTTYPFVKPPHSNPFCWFALPDPDYPAWERFGAIFRMEEGAKNGAYLHHGISNERWAEMRRWLNDWGVHVPD